MPQSLNRRARRRFVRAWSRIARGALIATAAAFARFSFAIPPIIDGSLTHVFDPDRSTADHFRIDAGAASTPTYEGSRRSAVIAAFSFDAAHRFERWTLSASPSGLSVHSNDRRMGVGAALPVDYGRSESEPDFLRGGSPRLRGMGKIAPTLEGMIYIWASPFGFPFFLGARRALTTGGHDGSRLEAGMSANLIGGHSGAFTLEAAFCHTWTDSRFRNTSFGVSDAQSARSGYAPYRLGAGTGSDTSDLLFSYRLSRAWSLYQAEAVTFFPDSIRRSPIVGGAVTWVATAGVSWEFGEAPIGSPNFNELARDESRRVMNASPRSGTFP